MPRAPYDPSYVFVCVCMGMRVSRNTEPFGPLGPTRFNASGPITASSLAHSRYRMPTHMSRRS